MWKQALAVGAASHRPGHPAVKDWRGALDKARTGGR